MKTPCATTVGFDSAHHVMCLEQTDSWPEAEEMCRSLGSSLVEVDSREEHQFLNTVAVNKTFSGTVFNKCFEEDMRRGRVGGGVGSLTPNITWCTSKR
ncbi:hypothetical protein BaRGS_00016697 [Batillaria attramentaria]|uniref:C-type lectin domain-containing protein n=1 Tax=Batillaria attramentaria TaxID=370345 RepID=A0ABD0KYK9_9CAEN